MKRSPTLKVNILVKIRSVNNKVGTLRQNFSRREMKTLNVTEFKYSNANLDAYKLEQNDFPVRRSSSRLKKVLNNHLNKTSRLSASLKQIGSSFAYRYWNQSPEGGFQCRTYNLLPRINQNSKTTDASFNQSLRLRRNCLLYTSDAADE